MIGIIGYGGYVPRLRLSRKAVVEANGWFAPQFASRAKGTRAMANWDEDSITMAVAAARDCLGAGEDRSHVSSLHLVSNTLPFAERLNSGLVCQALRLSRTVEAVDQAGSQRAAMSALGLAFAQAYAGNDNVLVLAADNRKTRAAGAAEIDTGDGAAAILVGRNDVLAEYLGSGTVTVDFVDHFRQSGKEIDYVWEERWIRNEGIGKLVPEAIRAALRNSGVEASEVSHFIFPTTFQKMDMQLAKACGIAPGAVADNLAVNVGDTGVAHPLLMLAHVLETAQPEQVIVMAQFGSGAQAHVFRVTDAILGFRPRVGVTGWLARGVVETSYTKFLFFKQQLELDRGMRAEQDKKTALTTLYRHREAILGLVAGRCRKTGEVHFPPSRFSYTPGAPELDTQEPYCLAERRGQVLSWSAETLSAYKAPPHQYGQVDFDGGGRILMEFTDVGYGDIDTGTRVEMVFRIKDVDELRGFNRYFWKATPVRPDAADKKALE